MTMFVGGDRKKTSHLGKWGREKNLSGKVRIRLRSLFGRKEACGEKGRKKGG